MDSARVCYLVSWIQKVEEEGIDPSGFIPEGKRVVLTVCDVDSKSGSARLEFMSKEPNGERRIRTETVE